MTSAPQPSVTVSGIDPATEVERLHTLLDRQPTCLMRIAVDGMLLAVNDAGLGLLGARRLAQVLGTSIVEKIGGNGAAVWTEFVGRVAQNGSASTECELRDVAGTSRVVTFQAVALPAHPDRVDSLFVTFRDVSTARRLEMSLREQEEHARAAQVAVTEATSQIEQLETSLHQAARERDELKSALDRSRAEREQLAQALAELKAALTTAIDATLLAQLVVDKGVRA